MKWRGARGSKHVVDRRRGPGGKIAAGGGVFAAVVVLTAMFVPGMEPLLNAIGLPQPGAQRNVDGAGADDDTRRFVEATLGYTEDVWGDVFESGAFQDVRRYKPTTLVLFTNQTESPCGQATQQSGPFYCPASQEIYIDPAFYKIMAKQLNSPGDFAQAYVIGHEVAHHVQNLVGVLGEVLAQRMRSSQLEGNQLTVRLELQADCYAGVWANRIQTTHGVLEKGDLAEALQAAHQVGDDVLQRMSGQQVDPNSFTHGAAEQRSRWFATGFESGDVHDCDTFSPPYNAL